MRALALGGLCGALLAGAAAQAGLSSEEGELQQQLRLRRGEMIHTLGTWVEFNTGTWNREGLERFAAELERALAGLGFAVERRAGTPLDLFAEARTGPLLVARRAARSGGAPRVLLSGHFDTVFERDSGFQQFRIGEQALRGFGPGVADMKGGLVVMFEALRALGQAGDLDRASWTIVLNSDEEIGSLASRAAIEREARRADLGLVFESARHRGGMVRSRRGLGQFRLKVQGVAAHSGSSHQQGRSAVRELAHKILRIEELTDYEQGLTLNVGTVRGGTKRNIVPESAEAWIDMRYDDIAVGEAALRALRAIAAEPVVEGTVSQLSGTLHRPPKAATDAVDALLELHATAARDLELELPDPVHAGGGTDGSLMAGVGLAVLDSMGVVGGGAHTSAEFIELESLPERAALTAIFLHRILHDTPSTPAAE